MRKSQSQSGGKEVIYTIYLSSLIISAVIAAALAFYLWRRRSKPGAMPAVWMMLAVHDSNSIGLRSEAFV